MFTAGSPHIAGLAYHAHLGCNRLCLRLMKGWCCGGNFGDADGDDEADDGGDWCDGVGRLASFVPGGHWMIPTTGMERMCESEFGAVSWNNNHSCDYSIQVRECNDMMDILNHMTNRA